MGLREEDCCLVGSARLFLRPGLHAFKTRPASDKQLPSTGLRGSRGWSVTVLLHRNGFNLARVLQAMTPHVGHFGKRFSRNS